MARVVLKGIAVSPGIAMGPLLIMRDAVLHEKRKISDVEVQTEIEALNRASAHVCGELAKSIANVPEELTEYREIVAAQIELARDPRILEGAAARIGRRKICAAWALSETVDEICSLFESMADPYLAGRAQDIKIIGRCLGNALAGPTAPNELGEYGVLASYDLSPADVMKLKLDGLRGILTVEGGSTSHTAILARGLGVPALVGVADLLNEARQDEIVIIDGVAGIALLGPDAADIADYTARKHNYDAFEREALKWSALNSSTLDGLSVSVCANLDNCQDLESVTKFGAEGIGLYRTEFSWLGDTLPEEDELVTEYRSVINSISPRRVIFRTLDIGADKLLPVQEALHEPNPALGMRGIRFCLWKKDIFRKQLRAILRAGYQANAAIMLPMVSCPGEIEETRSFLEDIKAELRKEEIPFGENMPLGVMVETPAAVMACEDIAARCDFLSIGTNDLLHYLMAIDRNNRHVAYLHEPLQPAFTRSLKKITDAAHKHGIEVSVCGELASDPAGIVLLLGMGVDCLSASPHFVPGIKQTVRQLDAKKCKKIVERALNETDPEKTRALLHDTLKTGYETRHSLHNTIINKLNIQS